MTSRILLSVVVRTKVDGVWLFDALYAETEKFVTWFDKQRGRLLNIYAERGGTKDDSKK